MMERSLRGHLETAINAYRSGASLPACLQNSPPEVHAYLRVFDQLAHAQVSVNGDDLRVSLRRRFVRGAMAELRSSEASGGRLRRVATAAVAAFIVGAAVNPALADELVSQVARTFGSAVSETVSRVLNDNPPASAEAAAIVDTSANDAGVPGATTQLLPGLPSSTAPDLPAVQQGPTRGGVGAPGETGSVPGDNDIGAPLSPSFDTPGSPVDTQPVSPASNAPDHPASHAASTPVEASAPPPAPDGASSPDTGGAAASQDGAGAVPAGDDDAVPPGVGLANSNGRGDELPDQANGGNRGAALDHAAESGNKEGQSGTPGNAGSPPGLVTAAAAAGSGPPAVIPASTHAAPHANAESQTGTQSPGLAAGEASVGHKSTGAANGPPAAAPQAEASAGQDSPPRNSGTAGPPEHSGPPDEPKGKVKQPE